jgi:hypothetical protein
MVFRMAEDKIIRAHLLSLMEGGHAHVKYESAIEKFPTSKINSSSGKSPHTFWDLLEHTRIAQHDILDFIKNPKYKEMEWPKDYWPPKGAKAAKKDWENSIALFKKDSDELQRIIKNPKTDLYAKIPHGDGQTIMREMLLVADHNSYHIGEFVQMRKIMGAWKKGK